jgi:hypothetical protein
MASIYVQVGNDVIEFPEGTTDEQIEKLLAPQAQVTPPSSGFYDGFERPYYGWRTNVASCISWSDFWVWCVMKIQ